MASDISERSELAAASKAELKGLEDQAKLPPSSAAGFMQIVGILCVLAGVATLLESVAAGATIIIASGFIIAAGRLQQTIFDIRTLLLREKYSVNSRTLNRRIGPDA